MSIIVSLTSTSDRQDLLEHCLLSLMRQVERPDKIFVNISKGAYLYDKGIPQLSSKILLFENDVIFNWVENTGSYRKLLPVLGEIQDDDILVTCDDDIIYGRFWLAELKKGIERHPDCIVCSRARKPVYNLWGGYQSYLNWPLISGEVIGSTLLPIGMGGVAYKKKLLDINFIFDKSFLIDAPRSDDIWFRMASLRKKTSVAVIPDANSQVFEIRAPISLANVNARPFVKYRRGTLLDLIHKIKSYIRTYIGLSECENDVVLRKLRY